MYSELHYNTIDNKQILNGNKLMAQKPLYFPLQMQIDQ